MCPTGTTTCVDTSSSTNLRSAFDVLDVDHDGKISRSDLQSFYGGYLGPGTSQDDVIGSMITLADSNNDGFVEYHEFEKVIESNNGKRNENGDGIMEDVFKVMDKDGDGKVGVDDLKTYLGLAGFDAGDEDVMAMLKLAGPDCNAGGVTYQGFLKILAV
ncbi:actin or actin-binding cytoskeletal protein [Lithospermum erythrorhizon]|uniref:Actin or actin-binding cytoskeletal protein n=1 Tax=Lithospermum erythrorhizon TaxID=34254 RepID=A0AAV3QEF1_LITER